MFRSKNLSQNDKYLIYLPYKFLILIKLELLYDGMILVHFIIKIRILKMELMQIIAVSLKLFIAVSAVLIVISYSIYKIKSRSNVKPYLRPAPTNASKFRIKIITHETEEKLPEVHLASHKRFKVVNEKLNLTYDNSLNKPKLKLEKLVETNKLSKNKISNPEDNILTHYSNNNFEPMHKLKV
ncbi:MAG TPA: hypothetical protein ENI76_03040 [Ignavibacteria bacterium]|nr:hypothetical protein [Ignavibacteria bacterium]